MDVLVHGQAIAIPLGIERRMPAAVAVAAAERLWATRFPLNPRHRFRGSPSRHRRRVHGGTR
jgi:hypothetical protein